MIIPYVEEALRPLEDSAALQAVLRRLEERLRQPELAARGELTLAGLTDTAKALAAAILQRSLNRPVLWLPASSKRAEALLGPLRFFYELLTGREESEVVWLPACDVSPYRGLSLHPEIAAGRAAALWKLGTGAAALAVVPIEAALGRLREREGYARLARTLRPGDAVALDALIAWLEGAGYERREPVEMAGEYSVRGGIVDVFSPGGARPVRLELFGDELEELREFDPATQRSTAPVMVATLLPLLEIARAPALLRRLWALREGAEPGFDAGVFPGWEFLVPLAEPLAGSLLQLVPRAVVLVDEPQDSAGEAEAFWERLESEHAEVKSRGQACAAPGELFFRPAAFQLALESRPRLGFERLPLEGGGEHYVLSSQPTVRFRGQVRAFAEELRARLQAGEQIIVAGASAGETQRTGEILSEYGVPYRFVATIGGEGLVHEKSALAMGQAALLITGSVVEGVVFPQAGLAVYGNRDLFEGAPAVARRACPKSKAAAFASDLSDLRAGDFVVHVEHGIGEFERLAPLMHDGVTEEFLQIRYLEDARLYVPLARADLVQKYRSLEGTRPRLDRLGGLTWQRAKTRAARALRDMAEELVRLYAERAALPGFAFAADTPWQPEFEAAFAWEETADQRAVTEEIKRDMEQPRPMDRLLVGDVGYGKTEVALRAAFKAVCQNKQVAVLAPTTVLAFQHYETFRQRFAAFPVSVEMLSRFRRRAEQQRIVAELEAGKIDVIVGTHRLLSKDVAFYDLGLLVVDEEQRFGVRHKEKLKQMRRQVDALTLTATPIPRTLHMALAGLRDLSLIETPPRDRLAIQTVVAPRSAELIRSALEQELARDGQTFFVHDRIETIYAVAEEVRRLVPRARVAVAHGQLEERELERVMLGFMRQKTNVLVTTKIIENGLDIPTANTILVDRADRFGLAELYQLRGRVGRSDRRAYAYLLVEPGLPLRETARRRLAALKEFSELGSAFRLAALDLELRGAGNLLGREQHGAVNALGFDLYTRMLERAIAELKGEAAPLEETETTLQLGADIRIPRDYIEDERQRLRLYKKIAAVGEDAGARRGLTWELEDRYGRLPEAVENLFEYSALKALCERLGIQRLEQRQGEVTARFHAKTPLRPARLVAFVRATPGARVDAAGVLRFPREAGSGLRQLRERLPGLEG